MSEDLQSFRKTLELQHSEGDQYWKSGGWKDSKS